MRYPISADYIDGRRGGPRRVAITMASVFVFYCLITEWQNALRGPDGVLVPLLVAGAMLAGVGYFQARRMAKVTAALSSLSAELSIDALIIQSSAGRHEIRLADVRRIVVFRTMFSKQLAYVGFEVNGRLAVVPPLQDNEAFAKAFREAAPHASLVEKRRFLS